MYCWNLCGFIWQNDTNKTRNKTYRSVHSNRLLTRLSLCVTSEFQQKINIFKTTDESWQEKKQTNKNKKKTKQIDV